jgi:uncharacterized PurR-regulated membrane protein YhhQ (DUF165 family)
MTARLAVASALFLSCILAANYVTTEYGLVTILGVAMTAGTLFAGATFVLRDTIQDDGSKWFVMALIVAGAGLSFLISAPFIALASGVAFLASETADLAVYTPLRERGYLKAAVASNIVGALVDTVLFLWIAGFPVVAALPGQMFGKLLVTLAVVAVVASVRAGRRVVTA